MDRVRRNRLLLVGFLYFILVATSTRLVTDEQALASIWPANAVLLAMLLQRGKPRWGDVLIAGICGNVLANFLIHGTLVTPFFYSLIDVGEAMLVAVALRRTMDMEEMLGAPENVGRFVLWAGGIAPAVSGLGGAGIAWAFLHEDFLGSLHTWYLSDALGLLIFTPFFTSLLAGEYRQSFLEKSRRERIEALAIHLLVLGTAIGVFMWAPPAMLFLLFAPLMLVTFKLGRLGTQVAIMIVTITGVIGTLVYPSSALHGQSTAQHLHLLQFFLALMLLTCLPVAASLSARNRLTRRLADSERQLRAREGDLIRMVATDPLTGLLTRAAFNEQVEEIHPETRVAIAMLDVDRFKQVNDQFGHDAGDRALIHFARLIGGGVRQGDIVARAGGDEFIILFPDTGESDAETVCQRLAATLARQPLALDEQVLLELRMSCGVAERRDGETIEAAIRRADQALYAAKGAGRARVTRAA